MHLTERKVATTRRTRQAGAGSSVSYVPELNAGNLDCLKDVFDHIDRRLEERNRLAVASDPLVKSYQEGRVRGEAGMVIDGSSRKWNLVFCAIENRVEGLKFAAKPTAMMNSNIRALNSNRGKFSVRRITKLVQGPKGIIPSLVWIEPVENGDDFGRDILTNFSPGNKVLEFVEAIGDRELRLLQPLTPGQLSSGVSGLIERRADGLKDLDGEMCPTIRKGTKELEFPGLGASIRLISLTNQVGWMFITVLPDCRVQFGNLFFRAL